MSRFRRLAPTALLVLVGSAGVAGCGGSTSSDATGPSTRGSSTPGASAFTTPPSSHPSRRATPSSGTTSSSHGSSGATKLLVFVVENHSLDEMRSQMPWTYQLAVQYGQATDYHALSHPSLPNYLAIAGGSTFGVTDDDNPSAHPLSGPSVFGAALQAGLTARVYADAMTSPCQPTSAGEYAVRHNPWTYFASERSECEAFDTPLTRFASDVQSGQLPDVGMVVPDVCHDAHDCSLAIADAWLHQEVGLAMSGPDFRSGRLAIVITADEDDRSQANTVLTVMVHPAVRGVVTDASLSHLSLSRLYSEVLGVAPLRSAATAPSMAEAFGLPLGRS